MKTWIRSRCSPLRFPIVRNASFWPDSSGRYSPFLSSAVVQPQLVLTSLIVMVSLSAISEAKDPVAFQILLAALISVVSTSNTSSSVKWQVGDARIGNGVT